MRSARLIVVAIASFIFLSSLAYSQDPVIVLKHKELDPHQRPLAAFGHERHAESIDCVRCHHDPDRFGNNKGGEGQPCSDCHPARASRQSPVALDRAFHIQCKSCHEALNSRGQAVNAPVMCGDCHVRK